MKSAANSTHMLSQDWESHLGYLRHKVNTLTTVSSLALL